MDNKKYYYLKLKENFYDSEEMIVLQNMQDGYLFSDILMKLYLRSLKNNGKLMFKDMIPYTPTAMAQVVRHQVGTVERALKIFKELGLIEVLDNGAIYLLDIQNFIGKSSTEADRQRHYYDKITNDKKKLCKKSCKKPYIKSTPEIELEIELDKEIDIDTKKDNKELVAKKPATLLPQQEVYNIFSAKYLEMSKQVYKSDKKDFIMLTDLIKKTSKEQVIQKIEIFERACKISAVSEKPIWWCVKDGLSAFTIGNFVKNYNLIIPFLTDKEKEERRWEEIDKARHAKIEAERQQKAGNL